MSASASRTVMVAAGQEMAGVNFRLGLYGEISGRVIDENDEPVPGIAVILISREYALGTLRYVYASSGQTNDQGEYTLGSVAPGRAFLLMARVRQLRMDAISDAPADPQFRKRAVVPTYYPAAPSMEGAQTLTLASGEKRGQIDIRMRRSPSYCIDGTIEAGSPGVLQYSIAEQHPASGAWGGGSMFMSEPGGQTGPDGRVRICGLHPGTYRMTAYEFQRSRRGAGAAPRSSRR
jgi:hypothetical protein